MIEHDYQFDSVAELAEALNGKAFNPENQGRIDGYHRGIGDWICSDRRPESMADTLAHLTAPLFPVGVERVERLLGLIQVPAPVSRVRRRRWEDAGDELCRDRLFAGDIDRMWSVARRTATTGPSRVHVILTVRAMGHVDSLAMARRGAVGVAITQALQTAGYVVRLSGRVNNEIHTRGKMEPYRNTITLIREGEHLDIHKLASLAASSLLFRGVILAHEYMVAHGHAYHIVPPTKGDDSPEFPGFDATIRVMDIPESEDAMSVTVAKALAPFVGKVEG